MKRFFSANVDLGTAVLTEQEAHHALHVLRCKEGEEVEVVNGRGTCWKGNIFYAGKKGAVINGLIVTEQQSQNLQQLTIAISLPKNTDRLEWAVEKMTELGIKAVIPIHTSRTERSKLKGDRLVQLVISAMKQSGQLFLPEIYPLISLDELLRFQAPQRFLAHCAADNDKKMFNLACRQGEPVIICIGPEGDFTAEEVAAAGQAGWEAVSLGNSRLRVETAAVYAASVVKCKNGL